MSPRVHRDHPIAPGKISDLVLEIIAVLSVPMKQDQRKAAALFPVMKLNVCHNLSPSIAIKSYSLCRSSLRT